MTSSKLLSGTQHLPAASKAFPPVGVSSGSPTHPSPSPSPLPSSIPSSSAIPSAGLSPSLLVSTEAATSLQPRTILVMMGPCTWKGKNGSECSCTSGSCTSETGVSAIGGVCDDCGHLMSMHSDYAGHSEPVSSHAASKFSVVKSHPLVCPRTYTVEKLAAILEEKRVAHVRGTPSSGKTTLACLLWNYYEDRGEPVVFIKGWESGRDAEAYLIKRCEERGYRGIPPLSLINQPIVLIFDEAQLTYNDWEHLWDPIIKAQSGLSGGLKICLFSSYGSPTTGSTNFPLRSTPHHFGISQRVSISISCTPGAPDISLFYSQEEFDDVVKRVCSDPTSEFALDDAACEYLYSITNGHPAAVNALLKFFFKTYRSDIKHHVIERLTKEHLIQALDDEAAVFRALKEFPLYRSFPSPNKLTVDAANVLRKTLQDGSVPRQLEDPGIRLCYEMGWVHSETIEDEWREDTFCVLPSKLHEKFVEYHLTVRDPVPFPLDKFASLPDLCKAVLQKFSRKNLLLSLKGRMGAAARVRPLEAQFQDEWYHAINSLLGHSVAMSSEWSRGGDGRIDFRIVGPGWGIEFLRDGNRLTEHCNRFSVGGAYYRWIAKGWIKDWIILDCRHSRPQKYQVAGTKLWRVVFKSDYSSAHVLDCDNQVIIPEFPLMG